MMEFPRGYAPSFSGPSVPIGSRRRRRITSSIAAELPESLLSRRRRSARRARRSFEAAAGAAAKLSRQQRLVQRATMGWTLADQARIEEIGYNRWLGEQLDYESLDDGPLEEVLAEALPTLAMSPAEIYQRYEGNPGRPIFELIIASFLRAIFSPRQLFERMAVFWSDHFNIHIFSGIGYLLKPTDDREVVRAHALDTFPRLLSASAHSPAMLSYLTNDSNVRGHPNENYARELMELHTLGVDNGYTETDVKEVARCFTGWTYEGRFGGANLGRFTFSQLNHDFGRKKVLGVKIPRGGGIEDGERVLEILAGHPNTARFVAEKLLRWLEGYRPSTRAVDRVADVYLDSGGDIRGMLRAALAKGRMKKAGPKLKRPLHLLTSAYRALFADVGNLGYAIEQLYLAGHLPFDWAPPNGYPDSEAYWSGLVLPRWNFASTFLWPGSGSEASIPEQLIEPGWAAARIVDTLDAYLLNGRMSEATRAELTAFLKKGKVNNKKLADAIGLAVASPEFQEY